MKTIMYKVVLTILFIVFILFLNCEKDSPIQPSDDNQERGSWAIYTPYDWPHDGKPYYSDYCTIYNDAASSEMKQQVGEIADARFTQILSLFNFQKVSDFRYPLDYSKIEI